MKITDVVTEAKKDSGEINRTTARDPRTAVALRRAYSKYPTANSDIEAYIRQEIEKSGEVDQDLERQQRTNTRQDSYLSRLQDLTKKQNAQLKSLDDENDDQEREIKDLEQQLYSLSNKPIKQQDEPKKEKPAAPRAQSGPAFEPTPAQARREKARQAKPTKPATPAPAPAVKAPTPAPAKTIDMMPAVKDVGDKDTFTPTVKQLAGPSDPFARISQELQPRQKEFDFEPRPARGRYDTSQATDVPFRTGPDIAKDVKANMASRAAQMVSHDPEGLKSVARQKELELAEQLKTLAGIR